MFFRLLILFLLVYLMVKLVQSFIQPKVHQSSNTYKNTGFNSKRKEGETFIENLNSGKSKKIPKNEGDYIDYEDV
jgi:Na+-transporting methylmalonyl-CoA/oxaloacetate decarboxylase gamma subunit